MNTPFTVELLSFAQKDLKKLRKIQAKVVSALLDLEQKPDKGHELKQNLQGIRALEFAIKGSGQFRAAYLLIENDKVCSIIAIGSHENFYELVAKRIEKIKTLVNKVREANRIKSKPKKSKT